MVLVKQESSTVYFLNAPYPLCAFKNGLHHKRGQTKTSTWVPKHDEVDELDSSAEFHLVKPDWWDTVQLCFQSRDLSSRRLDPLKRQCRLSQTDYDSKSCAHVSFYTQDHYDYTDDSQTGCEMKWTVESESQKLEQWFLDVEICVRYFPNDVSQVALLFAVEVFFKNSFPNILNTLRSFSF